MHAQAFYNVHAFSVSVNISYFYLLVFATVAPMGHVLLPTMVIARGVKIKRVNLCCYPFININVLSVFNEEPSVSVTQVLTQIPVIT